MLPVSFWLFFFLSSDKRVGGTLPLHLCPSLRREARVLDNDGVDTILLVLLEDATDAMQSESE